METQKPMTHQIKGLIIGLISVVFSLAITVLVKDFEKMQKFSYISFLILGVGIIWACMSFATQNNGNVSFGNVFAHGFKTSIVILLITLAYSVLSTYIFPELMEKGIEISRQKMLDGNMNEEQVNKTLEMTKKYGLYFMIGGLLLMYAILGALFSAVGAAVSNRNPNYSPFSQQ
jgi:hypothetical protein